jgi:predicted Zn-ribbon and HTH transcriptional regulator
MATTTMPEKTCPYCGYKWTSRIESPKSCPECKNRLRRKEKIVVTEKTMLHKNTYEVN